MGQPSGCRLVRFSSKSSQKWCHLPPDFCGDVPRVLGIQMSRLFTFSFIQRQNPLELRGVDFRALLDHGCGRFLRGVLATVFINHDIGGAGNAVGGQHRRVRG